MTPLDEILKSDPNEPRLTRAQERRRDFTSARRQLLCLGRPGVETFTATSDRKISDQELYSPANNSTVHDIRSAAYRAVMLWECVIRDAREGCA
jgi:hypothetical protein